jgi:hypothetical protein
VIFQRFSNGACVLSAVFFSALISQSVSAGDKVDPRVLGLCGTFIVDKNPAEAFQTVGGNLAKVMRQTARENVPVNYTLQSLGFQVPTEEPIKVHGAQIFSQFYSAGTRAQTNLDPKSISSYTGKQPNLLVIENGRDLNWFFSGLQLYSVNDSSFLPGLTAAPVDPATLPWTLPSQQAAPTLVDHVLAPEVWQTLTREERRKLIQHGFERLQWGGTLRITVRVKNVDLVAPELNGFLDASGGIQQLWNSMQRQVAASLPGQNYKMMLRVQKVSYEPDEAQSLDADFNEGFGPSFNLTANFSPLNNLRQPGLQALLVIRKPGSFWGDTLTY